MVVFTRRRQLWAVNIFSRPVNTLIITISNCSNSLVLAVYVYICLNTGTRDIFWGHADNIGQNLLKKNSCPCDSLAKQSNMSFSLFKKNMLLLRPGDVERNPGPLSETGLCVVHVNVRSLGKKNLTFSRQRVSILTSLHCLRPGYLKEIIIMNFTYRIFIHQSGKTELTTHTVA